MAPREPYQPVDNRSHQEQLAASLMDCLGLEGAIHACQANSWDGVLDRLLARRPHPETASQESRPGRPARSHARASAQLL